MIYHVPKTSNDDVIVELNWFKTEKKSKVGPIPLGGTIPRFAAFKPTWTFLEIK